MLKGIKELSLPIESNSLHPHGLSKEAIASMTLHLESNNNFPTAAGLASSASGYACLSTSVFDCSELWCSNTCLARTLAQIFNVQAPDDKLSILAR